MIVTFIQPYYHNVWEALGIGYIASYCKNNYKRGALRMNFFQGYFDSDDDIINSARYSDIVGISATSPTVRHGCELAKKIKDVNPKCHIVMGGWHVTATKEVPEGIDQIVVGEGEEAFLRILNGEREKIVIGNKLNFEELPWPDRELIKNHRTIDLCEKMTGKRTTSFQSNRGCPMNCAYCSEVCMTGKFSSTNNPIRTRKIDDTLNEIAYVNECYKLDMFKFVDATFDISEDYVKEFCQKKNNRSINIQWECLVHAAFVSESMIKYLYRSMCHQINVGCESGSPKVLRQIRKGTNIEKIKKVFDLAKRYGVKARAFFILGMPDETLEDIRLTEKFAELLDADVIGFTILCPYPGCDFYDNTRHKYISWDKTDEYGNDFWRSNHLENWELHREQRRLMKKFNNKLCERQK